MRTGEITLARARRLRREMTPPERLLWSRLRTPGDTCPHFRRQHPIGRYIADFYCPGARLVVEVDGWGHNQGDQPQRDEARDAWLIAHGLIVARFPESEVFADADAIADAVVRQALAIIAANPPPLQSGGGGGEADGGGS